MNAIGTPRWDIPTQSWVEPENGTNDEVRRMSGADPGSTPQSACVHSFFVLPNGKSHCPHCDMTLERPEP